MSSQNLYSDYSESELLQIAKSYHPIASFRLICAVFGEKYTAEDGVRWLSHYTIEIAQSLDHVLSTLTERERQVLEYRFGLSNARALGISLQSIGDLSDLTRERIRQIEAKALRKMRHPTRIRHLSAMLPEK